MASEYEKREEERERQILEGENLQFEFFNIPGKYESGEIQQADPYRFYSIFSIGKDAVSDNARIIEDAAREFSIDPDLLRAIIFMENSRGWYDIFAPLLQMEKKSYRPGNIGDQWLPLLPGMSVDDIDSHPQSNIRLAAKLLAEIEKRLKNPTIAGIATLYNGTGFQRYTEYGLSVEELYRTKPWLTRRSSENEIMPSIPPAVTPLKISPSPISFDPTDPLAAIYHTPMASSPTRSANPQGQSSTSGASSRHDSDGGGSGRDFDGSSNGYGSSRSNGGTSSGSSKSSKGSSSSAGGYASTPSRGPTPSARPSSSSNPQRDNQSSSYGGSWSGSVGGSSKSTSGKTGSSSSSKTSIGSSYAGQERYSGLYSPVLLDIIGNGLSIDPLETSTSFLDLNGNGYLHRMASPGAGTGMLVLDADADGKVSNASEFVFTEWDKTATGDLEAIRNVFDTNGNGSLDTGDARWSEFKVLVDGILVSLDSLGITSIDLTPVGSGQTFADGSAITGTTTFTRADGSTGTVGDARLVADSTGYVIREADATNPDGSTRREIAGYRPDGSLAFRNVVIRSVDGNTVETLFDDDGNGVVDRSQVKATQAAADGSRILAVSNYGPEGNLRSRTTTITSVDGHSVTTLLDRDGDSVTDERQVLQKHSDGSSSTVTEALSVNGTVLYRTTVEASADGLEKTSSTDIDGDGFIERVQRELVSLNADGSRTKTVTLKSADGTVLSTEVTDTSADNRTRSTMADLDGDGDTDSVTTTAITVAANGAVTVDTLLANANGTARGRTTETSSADGYSTVTSSDVTGDGIADLFSSDVTSVGVDGSRVQTMDQRSGDGALLERTVTTTSADQKSRTITFDENGDGLDELVETIIVGASASVDTVSVYGRDGTTLVSRSTGTVSIDGMSRVDEVDIDGNTVVDYRTVSATVQNADGSATTTVTRWNGTGTAQIGKRVETVSADGLSSSLAVYVGSKSVADSRVNDTTVRGTDGSLTRTVTEFQGTAQTFRTVTVTSADRKTQTASTFIGGNAKPYQVASKATAPDGEVSETVYLYSPDGNKLVSQDIKSTSGDGLTVAFSKDVNGDGIIDSRTVETTSLATNGDVVKTLAEYRGNLTDPASLVGNIVVATSGNGLQQTTNLDADGDGDLDRRISDLTTPNSDGSKIQTISQFNGSGANLIDRTVRTISANGLETAERVDLDGDGQVDFERSVRSNINSDGSVIKTSELTGATGQLRWKQQATTERDGRSGIVLTDLNGDGGYDEVLSAAVAMNGDQISTQSLFSPDGTILVSRKETRTSADGLRTSVRIDGDGNGTFDTWEQFSKLVNADGSVTSTSIRTNGDGTVRIGKTVTTVSADGLTETTRQYVDGDDLADLTTIKKRTLNADGTVTEEVDQYSGRNSQKFARTTTIYNPDGRNSTSTTYGLIPLAPVQTRSDSFNPDGTRTIVEHTTFSADPLGHAGERKTTSISADGLSTTVKIERIADSGSVIGEIVSDSTALQADGAVIKIGRQTDLTGNLIEQVATTTSANGFDVERVISGQRTAASLSRTTLNEDGSRTRVDTYGQAIVNGIVSNVVDSRTTLTSANGLREETVTRIGSKIVRQDVDLKSTDGSSSYSTTLFNAGTGALAFAETVSNSADGLVTVRRRDSDGLGGIDYEESSVRGADGRTTVTVSRMNDDGSIRDKVITTTSSNGLSKTSSFDTDGNGTIDRSWTDVTLLNSDGSKTQTVSQFGTDTSILIGKSVVRISADGRTRETETYLGGAAEAGQRQVDILTFDANGNEVVTSTSYYADGTTKSSYEITRFRDSDRSFTYFDHNGDGIVDEYQIDIGDKAGNRQQTFGFPTGVSWRTGASDWSANGYGISETVDGRETRITVFAPDDPANPGAPRPILGTEKIIKSAFLDGTYSWTATDANGAVTSTVTHTIDVNRVDTIQWAGVRGTSGSLLIETSQRDLFLDRMQRIYDTIVDRDMQNSEREQLATYVVAGALDTKQLATNILNTTEFKTYYGSLSNTAFIDVLYQNAFGRDASVSEMQTWLGKLNSGAISRADLALSIAESAEHYVVGNTHVTTNVTSGQFLHSTDKTIAQETIERLYNVMIDRDPSSAEATSRTLVLTGGTKTKYQIAAEILASSTFSALYGTMTNDAFVSQMFQNAFGRPPEAAELQFWTGALSAGTSRADVVVAFSSNQFALSAAPKIGRALLGTDAVELLIGTIGNDTADGGAGNDTLVGLAGADTLDGGAGSDTMIGGAGDDTYLVDAAGDVVVENLNEGIDTIQTTLVSYVLGANVENLTYTGSAAFTGTGNGAANVITGGAGNDALDGKSGDDTLIGGAGNDTYITDSLGDLVIEAAGGGIDTIKTDLSSYSLAAINNVENLTFTGTGSFTGTGNALDNVISGGAGDDILSGGAGNDTLIGGAGADTLLGGAGDDTYIVDTIGDVVVENAGEGADTVQTNLASYTLGVNVENLTYTGSAAFTGTGNALDNTIIGGAAVDTLSGGDGDDTLDGKAGADSMVGGAGDDTYIVDNASDVIVENANDGIDTIKTSLATYSLASRANVENLIYIGTAAFNGTGNALDNQLRGGTGADTLSGGDGNDTLDGGVGADKMTGGAGDDTYIVDNASDVVTEAANGGNDTVKTNLASLTLAANAENLIYTGSTAFAGTGNALNNTIIGGNSNDTLNGGAGTDTMTGGTGDDTYIIDNAGDIVVENVGEGVDTIQTALASYTLGANVENLTYTGSAAFTGTGNALNNTIAGGAAADTLSGGDGDDTLDGKAGTDTMIGGAGDDTYIVDNLNDVVSENANEGLDTIKTALAAYTLGSNVENLTYTGTAAFSGIGNALANTVRGGAGADTLDGKAGADVLVGGAGNDTYIVDSLSDVVTEAANEGIDLIKTALAAFSLADIANVESLTFTGTGDFQGIGNALANTVSGGAGNDMLDGGGGADTMIGGAGNDLYIVDNVGDVVTEGANAGIDEIRTSLSTYTLASLANVENLTYSGTGDFAGTGNAAANRITGGIGNDTLDGGAGADTMIGGVGNDTYVVDNAGDIVVENASEGIDTIRTALASYSLGNITNVENLIYSGSAAFTGTGNDLNNLLKGGAAADTLNGGAGNDTLDGGAGSDTMIGGAGDDTYLVDAAGDVVVENLNEGIDTIQTTLVSYVLGANVENLTYTGSAAFTGTGNGAANVITGGAGNDALDGKSGDDTLIGGAGNDTYITDSLGDLVIEAAGGGIDTIKTDLSSYSLAAINNVENLTFTGTGSFTGTGNALDNVISGGAGDDILSGGAGNDTLIGGAGADTLLGGAGDDTYIVDTIGDVVVENAGEGADTVQTNLASYTLGVNVENLTYTGSAAFTGTGNALDNTIIGGAAVDTLSGGDGDDTLDGKAGADSMVGGAGDDTYIVDNASDVIVENANDGIDTIKTSLATYSLASRANVENLIYIGTAAFNGTGNALDNQLRGGTGADTLSGGDGNDTLDGGVGADKMTGGAGDDTYIVDNASDVVTEAANGGNDTVKTNLASLTLAANAENLIYTGSTAFAGTGNALNNTIIGGNSNDTLNGGAGTDTMTGGTGDDTYIIDNAGDIVVENVGEGVDTIQTALASYTLGANVENLTYTGSAAFTGTGNALNNTIAGGAAADTLSGGDGDDTLDGKAGTDTMIGGAGDDTYIVDNLNDVVSENANEGLDTIKTALASYSLAARANVENLVYTGTAAFTGNGNTLNNTIVGSFLASNVLDGGLGADTLWGGLANDTYIIDDLNDVVLEEAGGGTDLIKSTLTSYSLVRFSNVENLTFIGTGDFTATGNALKNVITGGTGNDVLDGGTGADTMIGAAGNDIYIVDNVGDVVTEGANAGIDEIRTSLSTYTLASLANVENLTYSGTGDFAGTGNAAANRISGGIGNDTLNGGAGADTMIGGNGNDTYLIDNAGDLVVENVGEGVDTIRTSLVSHSLGANVENLVYTGTAAFTGTGNELDNLIIGGSAANTLSGGGGNDVLIGGAAADFFVFTPNWGHDTIANFVATGTARDTIKIDSGMFADWASLLAASSQAGTDTIIIADVDNTITLKNVTLSSLQSTNFQFS